MEFLIIICGLMLLRYFHNISAIQTDTWFARLVGQLGGTFKQPKIGFIFSLLAPVLLVVLIDYLLAGTFFGLSSFFFSLLVLVYSMGRGDLTTEIEKYKADLQRNDVQAAFHDAAELNVGHEQSNASSIDELQDESVAAIGYRYLEHYFAAIFWFLLAGSAGALLYRLVQLHQENKYTDFGVVAGARFLKLLEWLPVRLMGVTLVLVGNFLSCVKILLDELLDFESTSTQALRRLVCGALDVEPESEPDVGAMEIAAVQSLLQRALVCMICLIALWVIFV